MSQTTFRPPARRPSARVQQPELGLWFVTTPEAQRIGTALALRDVNDATIGRDDSVGFAVHDQWLSRRHLRLERRPSPSGAMQWWAVDLNASNGTQLNGRPLRASALREGDVLRLGATVLCFGAGHNPAQDLGLKGISAHLHAIRQAIRRYAREPVVYVSGAPGAGKELVAKAIHKQSGRTGTMLAMNMATVVDTLAESLLFGHRKGAFSGALHSQPGALDTADGGTLLLDEVAETTPAVQAKLLRAVQFGEIHRIGDAAPHHVDAQLVVASHRDLEALVADGSFRDDLYWRIAGFQIDLPPLKERRLDVGPMLWHFIENASGATFEALLQAQPDSPTIWRASLSARFCTIGPAMAVSCATRRAISLA